MTILRAEPIEIDPLAPGAPPSRIRAALFAEDRAEFDAAYTAALRHAGSAEDEAELYDVLERWRQIAVLEQDRDGFQRVARRAAELLTGEDVPADEPLSVTRARTGF